MAGVASTVGLGLYWAWTFYSFNQVVGLAVPLFAVHVASMLGACVTLAPVCLLWRRLSPLTERSLLLLASGIVASGGSALCLVSGLPGWLVLVGAACSGGAVAVVVCSLGEGFCLLPAAGLLGNTLLFFLLACALMLALTAMTQMGMGAVASTVACAMPLSASALMALAGRARGEARREVSGANHQADALAHLSPSLALAAGENLAGRIPWRTLALIVCLYLAVGGVRVYVERLAGALAMDVVFLTSNVVVLSLLFVAVQYVGRRVTLSLAPGYRIAIPVVIVCYVLMVAVGPQMTGSLSVASHTTSLLCEMLCWMLVIGSVHDRGLPPLLMVALGRLLTNVGMLSGELLGEASLPNVTPFAVMTVLALVLSLAFLSSEKETSVSLGGTGLLGQEASTAEDGMGSGLTVVPAVDPSDDSAVSELADAWGLTERERDILDLWVTSHGARQISERLGLSESTVKTHVRHIYEKSGVHSRAELIALLEDREE